MDFFLGVTYFFEGRKDFFYDKSPFVPLVRGSLPHCPSAISEVIQNFTNSIPKVLCL